jgi:hypothetical protein
MKKLSISTSVFLLAVAANAAIVAVDHGTGPPPAMLGPWSISALPFDSRSVFSDVTDAPGYPIMSGDLTWDIPMSLRHIGSGWATWSHGYTGVVYFSNGATGASMTLPTDTVTFLMYIEPNAFSWQTFTVTAQDGTSITRSVHGSSGAAGFGFYGTDGTMLVSISVSGNGEFAWGEFYSHVPEPSSLSVLGLGSLLLLRRR